MLGRGREIDMVEFRQRGHGNEEVEGVHAWNASNRCAPETPGQCARLLRLGGAHADLLGLCLRLLGHFDRQIAVLELRAEPWHEGFSK